MSFGANGIDEFHNAKQWCIMAEFQTSVVHNSGCGCMVVAQNLKGLSYEVCSTKVRPT